MYQTQITSVEDQKKLKALLERSGATVTLVHEHEHSDYDDEESSQAQVQPRKTFAEIIADYGMTQEQVDFYKKYSMERSRKAYELVAVKELGTSELIDDWVYMGYYDAGFRGAEYCEAGHALRYVHIALNKKTGREIKFGIKCVTDFFNLTPAQIKFIKNGFNEANAEIQQSIDRFVEYNGDWDQYEEKFHFKEKLDFILERDPSAFKLDYDPLVHLLKLAELKYMFQLKLFLPQAWEHKIDRTRMWIEYNATKQKELVKEVPNLDYIKRYHINIYTIIDSIKSRKHRTEKQEIFVKKLIDTPWQEVDDLIQQVQQNKIVLKPTDYYIYGSLIGNFNLYGFTEKQYALFKKIIDRSEKVAM